MWMNAATISSRCKESSRFTFDNLRSVFLQRNIGSLLLECLQSFNDIVIIENVTTGLVESLQKGVMLEVDNVTQNYSIIARSCSAVFAVLEQLHHINQVGVDKQVPKNNFDTRSMVLLLSKAFVLVENRVENTCHPACSSYSLPYGQDHS
jgi:hypothetical protein